MKFSKKKSKLVDLLGDRGKKNAHSVRVVVDREKNDTTTTSYSATGLNGVHTAVRGGVA